MAAKTYTEHKLTDPMLERLSSASKPGGMSMRALFARGLVEDLPLGKIREARTFATEAGELALAKARKEGW